MQSSPFASYPLGSIPPQGTPGSSNYLAQQQYGRPSGYPQTNYGGNGPSFDNNAQLTAQAMLMHQKQQALAHQQQSINLGGLGQTGSNLHPTQLAQMMQYQQQQQQQGGGSSGTPYGSHQQMYAQPTPPQPQHHQQSHHQPSHHSSSHARDQSGDHHRSSKSSRRSKNTGPNLAIFSIPVESEADPLGDDLDGVTERSQAIDRYKLNHDLLGELFNPLPISKLPAPPPAPEPLYTISDLEKRLAELEGSNARLPDELSLKMDEVRHGFEAAAKPTI